MATPVAKRIIMTTPWAGHSHTILTNVEGGEVQRGVTSFQHGHSHDWIMDDAGNVIIGDADGHAHGISAQVMKSMAKGFDVKVAKVDEGNGIVFGFAVICMKNGERHFDLQDEHIPESTMMDFTIDFMRNSRVAKAMHNGEPIGEVLFGFPLTTEIAKSLDIQTSQTGFLIGMAPGADALAKYAKGDYTGFSIGGYAIYEDVEEEVTQ